MKDVTVSTKSDQVVETPEDFMCAVYNRFGSIYLDLAADEFNFKGLTYIGKQEDSLKQDWYARRLNAGYMWLNPPFKNIEPWVKKCFLESKLGLKILCLVPASMCTKWFRNWVQGKAVIYLLNERLKFVGHEFLYPKELMLLEYDKNINGLCWWSWKGE